MFVPCVASILAVLYAGRRVFASEHVVLAVHLTIGLLIIIAAAALAEVTTIATLARLGRDTRTLAGLIEVRMRWVMLALLVWYVYATLRRAHGDGALAALARAAAVAVGVILSLQLYDAIVEWVIRRAL